MSTTFHVSVPKHMEEFVEKRVKEKCFKTRGSYVQELIRQDQLRAEKVKLTNMLLVGLASKQKTIGKKGWNALRDEKMKQLKKVIK